MSTKCGRFITFSSKYWEVCEIFSKRNMKKQHPQRLICSASIFWKIQEYSKLCTRQKTFSICLTLMYAYYVLLLEYKMVSYDPGWNADHVLLCGFLPTMMGPRFPGKPVPCKQLVTELCLQGTIQELLIHGVYDWISWSYCIPWAWIVFMK